MGCSFHDVRSAAGAGRNRAVKTSREQAVSIREPNLWHTSFVYQPRMAKLVRDPEIERLIEELNQNDDADAPRPVAGPAARAEWPPSQVRTGNALEAMLIEMARRGASDLHVIAGSPPVFRVGGRLARGDAAPLAGDETQAIFNELMTSRVREAIESGGSADFSLRLANVVDEGDRRAWRFRVNIHRQRGTLAAAIRALPSEIPTINELNLPLTLADLVKPTRGLVLLCGPTGSGKTTTLAASLAVINQTSRKILTIEDPVEYQIPGINQTQVHPGIGLTFASALRSFLRQDPDVIMVGEMRDAETAHIGVHAALTGHLVLTTLHTNTAAGAITRMIDMGVESFLLASSVRAIIGQRLVRVLCEHCRERHELTAKEVAADYRYESLGFQRGEIVYRPKGCDWCGGTGFRGRKGVFEVMEISAELRRAIGPKTDAADLEAVARREGMSTMSEDGVAKCRAGITTLDEVFRVTMSL